MRNQRQTLHETEGEGAGAFTLIDSESGAGTLHDDGEISSPRYAVRRLRLKQRPSGNIASVQGLSAKLSFSALNFDIIHYFD